MKSYPSTSPRLAAALCAGLLSVATLGATVVAPAVMHFRSQEVPVLAIAAERPAQAASAPAGTTVVSVIDVNAVREARYVTVVEPASRASRRT